MKKYPPILDFFFVVLFVAIGRTSHDHGVSLGGMVSTTWPFAAGLVAGWLVIIRRHRTGNAPRDGLIIVGFTVVVAMTLRVIFGQGTAFAFVIVALCFLTLFLVGWRLVATLLKRRASTDVDW